MTLPSAQWLGDIEAKPAPDPLRRVQAFINTIDRESGQDRLATVRDAQPWLAANGLLAPDERPSDDDLRFFAAFREGLRALVMHNTGGAKPDHAATVPLREIALNQSARVVVADDGSMS